MDALIDRYRTPIIAGLLALVAAFAVWFVLDQRQGPDPIELLTDSATPASGGPIQVYITGAVNQPGVYELTDGDRAIDALSAAGGAAPEADLEAVNLAQRLHDEDQLTVPRLGDATSGVAAVTAVASGGGPATINLNSATAAELEALPGIGESYAQRIVDSRTTAGPFTTPEDLLTRELVPQSTYERIRTFVVAP